MNLSSLLRKHGKKRFISEGLQDGNAYMVVEDTIMYIKQQDCSVVEGKRLVDVQDYILSTFTLPCQQCGPSGCERI